MLAGTISREQVRKIVDLLYEEHAMMPRLLPGENRKAYEQRAKAYAEIVRARLASDLSYEAAELSKTILLECIRKGYYDALPREGGSSAAFSVLEMLTIAGFEAITPPGTLRRIASAFSAVIPLVDSVLSQEEVDELMAGIVENVVREDGSLSVTDKLKLAQHAATKSKRSKKGQESVAKALIEGFVNGATTEQMVEILESAGFNLAAEWSTPVQIGGRIVAAGDKVRIEIEIPPGVNAERFVQDLESAAFGTSERPKRFVSHGVSYQVHFPAGSG